MGRGLVVFDFDSTLMDGETIDFLAEPLGLKEEVAKITREAMEGKIDFFESLIKRVELLKGLKVEEVDNICQNLPFMKGAKETIGQLKKGGYRVLCFSGGFRNATSFAREALGFDADFSNILHSKNGILTGKVGGEMMFNNSKGDLLRRIQQITGISQEETIVVGDGANDLSMFQYGGVKIAFRAKPILRMASDYAVEKKDLREILEILAKIGRL
jgi:phosphoserine phosphatase